MATALSCVLDEVPVVHYNQLALGGPIRVARYETFGTELLAQATLDALEGRQAALMANHGVIVCGTDMPAAVENALLLEWLCGVYWHAAALGNPKTLTDEQCQDVVRVAVERSYGHTRPH
jgi:L-fuculose-phosphate aldolase